MTQSGCSVRYRGSDVKNPMHVMSYIMSCDLIKYGCDASYRVYDVVHIVGVMPYIDRV